MQLIVFAQAGNRQRGFIPAGGPLFSCVLLFAVRKIILHPLRVLIHSEVPSFAFIPQAHGLILPLFELVLFDLPHLFTGYIAAIVPAIHTQGRPIGGFLFEVLLRSQLLAVPRLALRDAVAVPGIEISLQDEILPASLALAELHACFQQFGEFQFQNLIHPAKLVTHPEIVWESERRGQFFRFRMVMLRKFSQSLLQRA